MFDFYIYKLLLAFGILLDHCSECIITFNYLVQTLNAPYQQSLLVLDYMTSGLVHVPSLIPYAKPFSPCKSCLVVLSPSYARITQLQKTNNLGMKMTYLQKSQLHGFLPLP